MNARIQEIYDRLRAVQRELSNVIRDEFPIGTRVIFDWGVSVRTAVVINHGGGGGNDVRVKGITGAKYWISGLELSKMDMK